MQQSPIVSVDALPVLILNACPDIKLQRNRAKILNDAGYYTSSARSTTEVSKLSVRMKCALAIVCYAFSDAEQQIIHEQLRRDSPETKLLMLDHAADSEPKRLLAKVKKALSHLEIIQSGERSA